MSYALSALSLEIPYRNRCALEEWDRKGQFHSQLNSLQKEIATCKETITTQTPLFNRYTWLYRGGGVVFLASIVAVIAMNQFVTPPYLMIPTATALVAFSLRTFAHSKLLPLQKCLLEAYRIHEERITQAALLKKENERTPLDAVLDPQTKLPSSRETARPSFADPRHEGIYRRYYLSHRPPTEKPPRVSISTPEDYAALLKKITFLTAAGGFAAALKEVEESKLSVCEKALAEDRKKYDEELREADQSFNTYRLWYRWQSVATLVATAALAILLAFATLPFYGNLLFCAGVILSHCLNVTLIQPKFFAYREKLEELKIKPKILDGLEEILKAVKNYANPSPAASSSLHSTSSSN